MSDCVKYLLLYSDKLFPALGFGCKIPPDGRVSHEYFLVIILHILRAI